MKKVAILGSTGSLGRQALEVITQNKDKLKVTALSGYSNSNLLNKQIADYAPQFVAYPKKEDINTSNTIYEGYDAFLNFAKYADYDIMLTTVMGIAGLLPTIAAIERGKTIALANKETLVVAGEFIMRLAKEHNATILPVDSEHSAILQCLSAGKFEEIQRLILTASGGAFRDIELSQLSHQVAKDALMHPNWSMGARITIDSATMVNKGFEVIEAMHLFGVSLDKIKVVIHRESIVHSMVEYIDNSVIAQLSCPDMRLSIQHALLYPNRSSSATKRLCFDNMHLTFDEVDYKRYPCFELAMHVAKSGGILPAVFNAADEVAVQMYLNGNIKYSDIHKLLERAVMRTSNISDYSIGDILELDIDTRKFVVAEQKKMQA